MKTTAYTHNAASTVIRDGCWRDIPVLMPLDIHQAAALKILARRWHVKTLVDMADSAIGTLIRHNASADATALVYATPRNIVLASAYADAELSVWDSDSADCWPRKQRIALQSLRDMLYTYRAELSF